MHLSEYLEEFTDRDWQTNPDDTLRMAVVGAGNWARNYAIPAINAATHCEFTTVITGNRDGGQQVAADYGADCYLSYKEYADSVEAQSYDAVYIATPNGTHLEHVRTAAQQQKAVLCEKPLESSVSRAVELVDICDRQGVPLMVAYRMHVNPAVRQARQLIQEGLIGDPVHVYGNNSVDLLTKFPDSDQWRLDPELVGYGTSVSDIGIYPINTARFLLDRDPRYVQANVSSLSSPFEEVSDERSSFLIEFEDDIHSAFTATQNAFEESHLSVVGSQGAVELSPAFHLVTELTVKRGDSSARTTFEWVNEMVEEFEYFADHVLTGQDIGPDGDHGLVDMYTLRAIYESAEKEHRVEV